LILNSPFIQGSVVLNWSELPILFLYEEVCCIGTFQSCYCPSLYMLLYELMAFMDFLLSQRKQSSGKCRGCVGKEFYSVVSNGVSGKSL